MRQAAMGMTAVTRFSSGMGRLMLAFFSDRIGQAQLYSTSIVAVEQSKGCFRSGPFYTGYNDQLLTLWLKSG
jgi:hypothetical protein